MNDEIIIPIKDREIILKMMPLVDEMVEKPNNFRLEWLREHQWAAVPVPDSMNDMDAEWISEAAHEFGYTECWAISIELDEESVCYKINMSQEGLLNFDSEFSLSNFLIIPRKPEFAILKEAGYYFIIAGPKNFVRKAVGCSFQTARAMFLDRYANDEFKFWAEKTRIFLISIAKKYEEFNG